MSFSGDLDHLSIIDVVQLMNAGRKSGTLTVRGRRGECQLVFSDGYIISANHCDNDVRIGSILVDAGVLTRQSLDEALEEQRRTPGPRKPLIASLIESGRVGKEIAYRGLETLIQLTIVEILTWKGGTFSLDPDQALVTDDYRYFPERLHEEVQFNTQFMLMDALRIYDEKKRDGKLADEPTGGTGGELAISADDLGLGDVDQLERKIPEVYLGLEDRPPEGAADRRMRLPASDLPAAEQGALAAFLERLPARAPADDRESPPVVLFGSDTLMTFCQSVVCKKDGLTVIASNEESDLGPILDSFLAKHAVPVLVLDTPGRHNPGVTPEGLAGLRRRLKERCPHLCVVQMVALSEPDSFRPVPEEGTVAVLPRPVRAGGAPFAEEAVRFLGAFPGHLREHARGQTGWLATRLQAELADLRGQREPADIALSLLRSVAGAFPRALNLVVKGNELISEKGVGFSASGGRDPVPVSGMRIPLVQGSPLHDIVGSGRCRFGKPDDPALAGGLYGRIGAPRDPVVLLLPLVVNGRTVSLTYGDFGTKEALSLRLEPWEILAAEAGLVFENLLYRRKMGTPSP